MKDRIKYVRAHTGLNQADFGEKLHVSKSAVQKWESGENAPTDAVVELMSQKTGVNLLWLRTGEGVPFAETAREAEMSRLFRLLMSSNPDAFRTRVVESSLKLLRYGENSREWELLEKIYNSIVDDKKKEADP